MTSDHAPDGPTPRRLALYLPSLSGGGAERVMVNLANAFAERGRRVDLVLARAQGPYLEDVSPDVRVIQLSSYRFPYSCLALARYLRRERPEAMLSAMKRANIVAILARKLARVKMRLVVSEHIAPSQTLVGGGMAAIIRRLMQRFYPDADAIVCVSQGMRDEMRDLLSLPDQKLDYIYNPLDTNRIRAMKDALVHHAWFSDRSKPVLLAAGRLTEQKDYPTLLRALALLNARRPARLVILGEGEERSALQALTVELNLADRVDFVGFQANPFAWMAACDVYVMSSKWEGLGNVLLEALACGAKIVSTDCRTGPSEILEDGKWGRLVPVGDAEALAQALEAALDDEDRLDCAIRTDQFSLEKITSLYIEKLTPHKENLDLSLCIYGNNYQEKRQMQTRRQRTSVRWPILC